MRTMLEFVGERTPIAGRRRPRRSPRRTGYISIRFLETSMETSTDLDQCRTSPSAEEVTSSLPPADQSTRRTDRAVLSVVHQAPSLPVRPQELHLSAVAALPARALRRRSRPPRHGDLRPRGVKMRSGATVEFVASALVVADDDATVDETQVDSPGSGRRRRRRRRRTRDDADIRRTDGARIVPRPPRWNAPRRKAAATTDAGLIRLGSIGGGRLSAPPSFPRGRRVVRPPPRLPFRHERGAGRRSPRRRRGAAPVRASAEAALQQHRRAHTLRVHPVPAPKAIPACSDRQKVAVF